MVAWGSRQALHGLGGVGKTQIAAEFAYRHINDDSLIGWIEAQRTELIPGDLSPLAPYLDVQPSGDRIATGEAVVAALSRHATSWLLVFDNAESVEDLIDFVPRSGVGHVIITSRRGGWEGVATSLDVDVMSEAEAVALPCGHVPGIDTGVAASVAELLGRLPLAVEQAAAYLRETGMPPEAYLRLLETRST